MADNFNGDSFASLMACREYLLNWSPEQRPDPTKTLWCHWAKPGYLYLIGAVNADGSPVYKIGYARNLQDRLCLLKCELRKKVIPFADVRVIDAVFTLMTRSLERATHRHFKEQRLFSEWFTLSDEQVERFADTVVQLEGPLVHMALERVNQGLGYSRPQQLTFC
jgi:hypothetical protein